MLKAICFDAAGTLIYLPRSVGEHYAEVAKRFGATLDPQTLDRAFRKAWSGAPVRPSSARAREDDDKGWWRELVFAVLDQTLSSEQAKSLDRSTYFEAVYEHFTLPGVWLAYDDVRPTLEKLRQRGLKLALVSNFDQRLHPILDGLGLSEFFSVVVISSEVGADKPDPAIFRLALARLEVNAHEAMHVGDDPRKDGGAEDAGLRVFHLKRPDHGLAQLLTMLDRDGTP